MKSAGGCVRSATKFSTSVQFSHYNFNASQACLGFLINRDTTAIVVHFDRSIGFKINFNFLAMTSERFIYRVIDDFPEAVHEATRIGCTDIHTWALANGVETFKDG